MASATLYSVAICLYFINYCVCIDQMSYGLGLVLIKFHFIFQVSGFFSITSSVYHVVSMHSI